MADNVGYTPGSGATVAAPVVNVAAPEVTVNVPPVQVEFMPAPEADGPERKTVKFERDTNGNIVGAVKGTA